MTATQTKYQTVISHHVLDEYRLACPCGWRNTLYTSKDQATDWAHAHDRTCTRTQGSTKEER